MGNARASLNGRFAERMSIREKIIEILAEQAVLRPSQVGVEASLADLGIDSLGLVEIVFAIEEAFEIQVPFNANDPSESEFDISSVGSIVGAVEGLVGAQGT